MVCKNKSDHKYKKRRKEMTKMEQDSLWTRVLQLEDVVDDQGHQLEETRDSLEELWTANEKMSELLRNADDTDGEKKG